jgi:hypothetical protein
MQIFIKKDMGRDEGVVTQKSGKPPSPPKVLNSKCIVVAIMVAEID